ncbi:MAG: 50S ribosomal protein L6 [Verrucomicrobiia bacterium]
MSRIGKAPILIPDKVKVRLDGRRVHVEGPKGKLDLEIPGRVDAAVDGNQIVFTRKGDSGQDKAMHGLARALVNNMVLGATKGFQKKLEINGVGFKAAVQGKVLNLSLGFSHPIKYPIPEGIKITVEDNTKLTVEGIDKQLVGAVAADIRSFYPPEPYKGKGVKYADEVIRRKEGKTAQSK